MQEFYYVFILFITVLLFFFAIFFRDPPRLVKIKKGKK